MDTFVAGALRKAFLVVHHAWRHRNWVVVGNTGGMASDLGRASVQGQAFVLDQAFVGAFGVELTAEPRASHMLDMGHLKKREGFFIRRRSMEDEGSLKCKIGCNRVFHKHSESVFGR